MSIERYQVLWLGPSPSETISAEFKRRHLSLEEPKKVLSDQDFAVSRAIVFRFDSKQKGKSIGMVKRYLHAAGMHSLLIVLCVEDEKEIRLLQGHIPSSDAQIKYDDFPGARITYALKRPAYELAELAARHPAGMKFNPTLEVRGDQPSDDDAILLRRAFGDCRAITLQSMKKGRSGARVFAVYAEFPDADVGPYPLPFFAKLDTRDRVLREYEAYVRFVSHYIPFTQRPNCDPRRCLVGLESGILVGDFVDNSVPLSDLVQPTGARSILHSLFDDALRSWRQQAHHSNTRIPLSTYRSRILDPTRIKEAHVQCAKAFGATLSPTQTTDLLDCYATHRYRRGPMHGDLTTENIHVRHGEAILIDFYKADVGPMVADLASLEIALCFSMEAGISWNRANDGAYSESDRFMQWRKHIDRLFVFVAGHFALVPPLQEQPSNFNWMWSVCRQLRLMAHYIESSEQAYVNLLVAYMLRMAMFPDDPAEIEMGAPSSVVRGYAYWCAERILLAIRAAEEAA